MTQALEGKMQRRTLTFGNTLTNPFPATDPRSLGLRTGAAVDAIIINGNRYGGHGGWNVTPIETLRADDYWTEIEVGHGNVIDYLRLRSREGREVAGGGQGGRREIISGIRVIGIGGYSRGLVDQLSFEVLEGYQPSAVVERHVEFVLDIAMGGQTFKSFMNQTTRTFQSYQLVTEKMVAWNINESAEIDLIGKFKRSIDYKTSTTDTTTIRREIDEKVEAGQSQDQVIAAGEAAFLICRGDIMKDSDGAPWMAPTSDADWVLLPDERFKELAGKYDITGGAAAQAGLTSDMINGFPKLRVRPDV
jgi:hypothetical protein